MLLVFILIISTNLIDKKNFAQLRSTTVAIYEDRLVADNLIYKLLQKTHEKEIAIVGNNENYFSKENAKANIRIENLMEKFSQTKLTGSESKVFNQLKVNATELVDIERSFLNNDKTDKTEILQALARIREDLSALSDIQLREGARQMMKSEQALESIELFTDIEIYLLIFLALVILFIILYNPKDLTAKE